MGDNTTGNTTDWPNGSLIAMSYCLRATAKGTNAGRFLLRPKCLHGIDGGGATSGNNRRDQAAGREQSTDGQDCNWVVPVDTKEKCLNGARREPRGNEPEDESNLPINPVFQEVVPTPQEAFQRQLIAYAICPRNRLWLCG
jgi:hypothetical protein